MPGRRRAEKASVRLPRDDWATPPEVLDPVREVIQGRIDFDPCGNPHSIVDARHVFMLERYRRRRRPPRVDWEPRPGERRIYGKDGLAVSWTHSRDGERYSSLFCNHPYGRAINNRWARRVVMAHRTAPGAHRFMLSPSSPSAAWFRWYWAFASCICFVDGRLFFLGAPFGADFESVVVYFGPAVRRFEREFGRLGHVVRCSGVRYRGPRSTLDLTTAADLVRGKDKSA